MSLFESLPDDLAVECLVRVPRASHHAMKSVSRSWRALLKSNEFYDLRMTMGLSESWSVFCGEVGFGGSFWPALVSYDMQGGGGGEGGGGDGPLCVDTTLIPMEGLLRLMVHPFVSIHYLIGMCFAALGRVVYIIGGRDDSRRVLAYDYARSSFKRCARLSTEGPRICCAVIDGRIFCRPISSDIVEIYDPIEDKWHVFHDGEPLQPRLTVSLSKGLAFGGKFYAEAVPEDDGFFTVRCYDPRNEKWVDAEPQLNRLTRGPFTAIGSDRICMVERRLYPLNSRVMLYRQDTDSWHRLCYIAPCSRCEVVAIGQRIYIVWDVEEEGRMYYSIVVETDDDEDQTLEWNDFPYVPTCQQNIDREYSMRNLNFCGTITL